jgi:hypothetical protein
MEFQATTENAVLTIGATLTVLTSGWGRTMEAGDTLFVLLPNSRPVEAMVVTGDHNKATILTRNGKKLVMSCISSSMVNVSPPVVAYQVENWVIISSLG